MGLKAPRNFSWVEEGQIAAFGWPKTSENIRFLLSKGIRHIVTLSPETAPPVERFPEVVWTEIRVDEFYPPTTAQAQVFIEACRKAFSANEAIGVHCWWGRGRTGTMLACYYVYFHGMSSKDAVSIVRRKRPMSIETHSQEQFVHEYYIFYLQNRPPDGTT